MFRTIREFFATPAGRNHWNAGEIWRETPQTRLTDPARPRKVDLNHPTRYL